jgi:hypothetical protein
MNDGWIKLHRQVLENNVRLYDDTAWKVFETLLLLVDRKTGSWSGGRYQLEKHCGNIKATTIYKAISRLKKAEMVTLDSNTRYSVISICKWSEYQGNGNTLSNTPSNTSSNTPSNTLTRSKEVRSKNNSNVELHSQYQPLHESICKLFGKNTNQYKLTDKRRKILSTRLKDTGKENIIKACEAISKSSFHMGDNPRCWIADPYWCLQSVEKAEEWSSKYESQGYKGKLTELEF